MMNSNMFRKQLFGGLNSADVEEYIQNMEHEIESIKVLHQKEKNELLKKVEEYEESVIDQSDPVLVKQIEDLLRQLEEKEAENSKLKEERETLGKIQEGEWNQSFSASDESGDDKWETMTADLKKENEDLKKRIHQQEELLKQQEENKKQNKEDELFDYNVVKKLMEDANKNADMIREEARAEAADILRAADKEAEQRKSEIALRMNSQLEEKGIQLMAAKYKIEQYVKSMNELQQEMYNLYQRMNSMVGTMPIRLDDYWDGEQYKMLENNRPSKQKQDKTELEETEKSEENTGLKNEENLEIKSDDV